MATVLQRLQVMSKAKEKTDKPEPEQEPTPPQSETMTREELAKSTHPLAPEKPLDVVDPPAPEPESKP